MFPFRDIILTTFILGLLPAVLVRPDWGILLWTWIGLMNPHKLTWGFAHDFPFAMIVGLVTIVSILISKEPKRLPMSPPVAMLLALVIWMTITTLFFSLYPHEAWEKWNKVMKIQLFIFLTIVMMQSEQRIRGLVFVSTLSIAYFGIKGGVYTIMRGGGGMVLGPDGGFIEGNTEIALALTMTLPTMRWLQQQTERRWLRHVATVCMVLIAVSVLGSYSRGGLLALGAMAVFLWLKSRKKVGLGIALVVLGVTFVTFMPEQWHEKMHTIETYQDDSSAMARIATWQFARNLAWDRPIGGGGFDTFQPESFAKWAPTSSTVDPHSIWFQMLAEHGFVGLAIYLLLWICAWRAGTRIIASCRGRADLQWASDLAAMIQAALVGFWVGGSFLGLAYWDYPFYLVVILVLTNIVVSRQLAAALPETQGATTTEHVRLRMQGP